MSKLARGTNRGFSAKAITGFAAPLLVTALLVGVALQALRTQAAAAEALAAADEQLMAATRLDLAAEEMVAAARGYLITNDDSRLRATRRIEQRFSGDLRILRQEAKGGPEARQLTAVAGAAEAYQRALGELASQPRGRAVAPRQAGDEELADLLGARAELERSLAAFVAERGAQAHESRLRAARARRRSVMAVLFLGTIGVMLSAAVTWVTTKQLRRSYDRERDAARVAWGALEARSRLLEIIAHDLRSPLAAVALNAELLQRNQPDPGSVKRAISIERIVHRMGALIANLLDVGAIESGGLTVRPVACAIRPLVGEAVSLLRPLAEEKGVQLDEQVEPTLEVMADSERLSQVLANLAGNAVKFTSSGGRVQVCAFRAGDSVRLAVKDTGPGMDPEAQARVFERYWKGDAGGRKGAGLGLYIAKAIVDAHGGRLWLESQLGAGSTFYCDLPSAQAAPRPVQQPEPVRGAQARTS